jgi:TRAP-type mannitol/chloroaromatic compound transport system permease small subunit
MLHLIALEREDTLQSLLRLSRIIDKINEWIGRFTAGFVLLMVLVGVWNVVGRYIGRAVGQNLSSNALIETQWYLFDLVFLLGAAYTLKYNDHVRVDIFHRNWSPKLRAFTDLLGTILFLIPFCIIVLVVSWDTILLSGGLARYPIKTMIIVSLVLLILQGISEAIKNLAILTNRMQQEEQSDNPGTGL